MQAKRIGLFFNALIGGGFTVLFLSLSGRILQILSTADAIYANAVTYMTMVGGTCILLAVTNVYSSYLRSFGYARFTLIATAAGNIMNIILNGVFIAMGQGVRGVSFATILSRILILALMILFSRKARLYEKEKSSITNREILREIVRIGMPAAGGADRI